MRQLQARRGWLLLGAGLCAAAAGCGDIGDAQLPLPLHRPRSSEPALDERTLELAPRDEVADSADRPQAVVRLSVAPAAACPFELEALLPDASASATLENGKGQRAVSGDGALISCRVAAQLFSEGVFELDLRVWRGQQPLLHVGGQLGPTSTENLAIELDAPGGGRLEARCPLQTTQLLDGAVWFQTLGCHPLADERTGAAACDIELAAIFENCRR